MTVVLDTNIFISALIRLGSARHLVVRLITRNFSLALSEYIIRETEEVLRRAKFSNRQILNQLWELVKIDAKLVKIKSVGFSSPLRDPKDHPILQAALAAKAEYLVTGDKDLLVLKNWRGIKIVTITEFSALAPASFSP